MASVEIVVREKIAMAKKVKKSKKQVKKSASKSKPASKKKAAPKKKAVSKKAALRPRLAMVGAAAAAADKEFIIVAPDVPESMVEATIEGFMNAGATKVDKEKKNNGNFKLTATFPS